MYIPFGVFSAGAGGETNSFELISTVITTGSEGQISFSSIPQIYKHLQMRVVARTSNAVQESQTNGLAINNDTTNGKYNGHALTGNGSSVGSSASGFYNLAFQMPYTPGANATTGSFSAGIIDILDYASTTKNKTIRVLGGYTSAGGNKVAMHSNLWIDTTAVSSLQYNYAGPAFAAGSRISLYGIKG